MVFDRINTFKVRLLGYLGFSPQKVLVIGYGVSGKAVMALLQKRNVASIAVDKNPAHGVASDSPNFSLEGITLVVVSPGVLPSHPLVIKARESGLEVIGELEFALRWTPNRCVGVTGSNGKTTTTLLIAHVLNTAGLKARAVGNIGTALSAYLLDPNSEEILIVELSSFQLETMKTKKLECAVYLNFSPNHLDRHTSLEEYAHAKANIQNCLKPGGKLFVSKQVWQDVSHTLQPDKAQIFLSSFATKYEFLAEQNISAAKAVCDYFGVTTEKFIESLPMFEKPPHRIEWVAESNGIRYYNDSKATSVEAVIHALSFFTGPVILLAGGLDKGSPYLPWITFRKKVKKIVAYGQASVKIQTQLQDFYEVEQVSTLAEALAAANSSAISGDTVLLSPGCSSYDQFFSYENRGDEFKKIVRETIRSKEFICE